MLEPTLRSFLDNMLSNFTINKVVVNIDPIFGGKKEESDCVRIVREFFPRAFINLPCQPNFCKAVIANWTNIESKYFLHIEDDWILNWEVEADMLDAFRMEEGIKQITFNNLSKGWDVKKNGQFHYQTRKIYVLGVKTLFKRKFPKFTTSPSLLDRDFARAVSARYKPEYDPEKQLYRRVNKSVEDYVRRYKNLIIGSGPRYPITDIGREWRMQQGISKSTQGAKSMWLDDNSQV